MQSLAQHFEELRKKHLIVNEGPACDLKPDAGKKYAEDFLKAIKNSSDTFGQDTIISNFLDFRTVSKEFYNQENKIFYVLMDLGYIQSFNKLLALSNPLKTETALLQDTELMPHSAKNLKGEFMANMIAKAQKALVQKEEKVKFLFGKGSNESALGILMNTEDICKNHEIKTKGSKEIKGRIDGEQFIEPIQNLLKICADYKCENLLFGMTFAKSFGMEYEFKQLSPTAKWLEDNSKYKNHDNWKSNKNHLDFFEGFKNQIINLSSRHSIALTQNTTDAIFVRKDREPKQNVEYVGPGWLKQTLKFCGIIK